MDELNQSIKFFQGENIRLASELLAAQNKYRVIRNDFNNTEKERNQITKQIQVLNNSINNTNIVNTPFLKEMPNEIVKDLKSINSDEKKDLDEIVSKIFNQ